MSLSKVPGRRLAMVVFVDHTDCAWLRLLRRGFRHCFVALEHPKGWLICDSLKTRMELAFVELPGPAQLAACYARQGHEVLIGRTAPPAPGRFVPVAPLTCVSVAMRALAIRAERVWTPWQLFQHLRTARPEPWLHYSGCRRLRERPPERRLETFA